MPGIGGGLGLRLFVLRGLPQQGAEGQQVLVVGTGVVFPSMDELHEDDILFPRGQSIQPLGESIHLRGS
jgi:hypothetical protein